MRRRTPAGILLAVFAVTAAPAAMACTCAMPEADRLLQSSDLVFRGTVIDAGLRIFGKATSTFRVEQVWKGAPANTVRVRARIQSAACGIAFKRKKTYLVFARKHEGKFWTTSCSAFGAGRSQRKIEADLGGGLRQPTGE